MRKNAAFGLLRWIVVLAAAGAVAVGGWRVALRLLRPDVSVTKVVERRIVQAFYATGTLQPVREYAIKSNNPGILTAVRVDKGDQVKMDQPLAVVLQDGVEFQYDQAKADRDLKARLADEPNSPVLKEFDARAVANEELLNIAKREEVRLAEALKRNAASQSDLDKALDREKTVWANLEGIRYERKAKLLDLKKDLEVAESALKIAKWNLDRQTVTCPVDSATVLDRPLSVGTRLAVNDTIMVVADVRPDKLVMRAQVDEEDKTHVSLGQLVQMTLYAYSGRTFQGRVGKIYDRADPQRRTFEVDVEMIDKDPGFAAGMTGELAFILSDKKQAPVIPSQAVQAGKVWLVRNGQLAEADAQLGISSVERVEVIGGISPSDQVLISPIDNMKPGQRVRPTYVDPDTAAGQNKPKMEQDVFRGFR